MVLLSPSFFMEAAVGIMHLSPTLSLLYTFFLALSDSAGRFVRLHGMPSLNFLLLSFLSILPERDCMAFHGTVDVIPHLFHSP